MTADLAKLEELLAAATPGPWEPEEMTGGGALIWGADSGAIPVASADYKYANAALIVALRNAAPALLSASRALSELRKSVLLLKIGHDTSCPRYSPHRPRAVCDCQAEEHNETVDALLKDPAT